jgi:hypothetical protein
MQQQVAYVYEVFKMSHHMALVVLGISKRSFEGFSKFSNKFPKNSNIWSEDYFIRPYLKHQLLSSLKIFVHKNQDKRVKAESSGLGSLRLRVFFTS